MVFVTEAVGWHALTALRKGVGARRTTSIGADQLRDTQSNNAWGGAMQGLVSAEGASQSSQSTASGSEPEELRLRTRPTRYRQAGDGMRGTGPRPVRM